MPISHTVPPSLLVDAPTESRSSAEINAELAGAEAEATRLSEVSALAHEAWRAADNRTHDLGMELMAALHVERQVLRG